MNPIRTILVAALLVTALAHHLVASGSPPERMSYQGYLVDADGVPLGTDGAGNPLPANYDVIFRLYSASSGGTLLWSEQQTITVDNGYFSVLLGEGTPTDSEPTGPLSAVFTGIGADERFVGVAVRFELGGDFTAILPRLRLLASPYAFLASQARSVVNPDGQALITAAGSDVTVAGTLTTTQPLSAPSISGSGAGLTDINASNLSAGTVSDSRLSGNVVRGNVANTFTAGQSFNSTNNFYGQNNFHNDLALNTRDMRLRNMGDASHGLGWYGPGKLFGGSFSPDGPVLYGNQGGALATSNGVRALRWDSFGSLHLEGTNRSINFGTQTRQHLNLWNVEYGIGIQSSTLYSRTNSAFAWHRGGSHSDNYADPGGGVRLALLDSGGNYTTSGTISGQTLLYSRTTSNSGFSELRFQQPNGLYGFVWYNGGDAVRGGTRRIYIGGSGGSTQMSNGSNYASYDGDGNWDFGSDARLKKDIEDAEPVLDRLLQVRLRSFRYKNQADDDLEKHRGVIAQELLPLFPDLISSGTRPGEDEPYLMVGYTDFGVLAVGAIQRTGRPAGGGKRPSCAPRTPSCAPPWLNCRRPCPRSLRRRKAAFKPVALLSPHAR